MTKKRYERETMTKKRYERETILKVTIFSITIKPDLYLAYTHQRKVQ